MQKLRVYQSLWAMEQRMPGVPELPLPDQFEKIHGAGYDGVCLDLAVHEIPAIRDTRPLFREFGLGCMVNAFPHAPEELAPLLDLAREFDAVQVNVIGGVMPLDDADAVPVVRRWIGEGAAAGLPLLFETHRDSLLNDLYYTLRLMERVPELRLCADLSHIVVDRELRLPLPARDAGYIRRILERSDCFQGRVASREQIQVAIDFPQHRDWVDQFRAWWAEGIGLWRGRNAADAELVFLCELGPRPYAITDGRQQELSDRWDEALAIRQWVRDIWQASEPVGNTG